MTGALVLLLIGVSPLDAGAQSNDDGTEAGFGRSYGKVLRIDPSASGFSFGGEFASARSSHQATMARGDARSIDPGLLGLALATDGCDGSPPAWPKEDQPQPTRADSRDPEAAEPTTVEEPPFTTEAGAESAPRAWAATTMEPAGIPGLIDIGTSRVLTTSGVVGPNLREATAEVTIDSVGLADGLITLTGLRWELVHRSGAESVAAGSFSLEAASLAGTPVPVDDPDAAFDLIAEVLAPSGMELRPPRFREGGEIAFVEPLAIAVVGHQARDELLGAVLGALQPGRDLAFEALLDADCGAGGWFTIIDLLVGSVTGAGSFVVELGGVEATTGEITLFSGLAGLGTAPQVPAPAPPAPEPAPEIPAERAEAAPEVTPPTDPPAPTAPPPADAGPVTTGLPVASVGPPRDLALLVALGVLGLGLGLAELDRRRIRASTSPRPFDPGAGEG